MCTHARTERHKSAVTHKQLPEDNFGRKLFYPFAKWSQRPHFLLGLAASTHWPNLLDRFFFFWLLGWFCFCGSCWPGNHHMARLSLKLWQSCSSLPSAVMTGMSHQAPPQSLLTCLSAPGLYFFSLQWTEFTKLRIWWCLSHLLNAVF